MINPLSVEVFNIGEVNAPHFDWNNMEESTETFKHFCNEGGFHYYARPRDECSELEARIEAAQLGFRKVIVDSLS